MLDWLTLEKPSITIPSKAMRSPGITRTVSPTVMSLTSITELSPRALMTVAVSGVSLSRSLMALCARLIESVSMASDTSNKTITIAASGHSPKIRAPVTATLIKAFMLKLKWRIAKSPRRYVPKPASKIATTAKPKPKYSGAEANSTNSLAKAKRPAMPNRFQGSFCSVA